MSKAKDVGGEKKTNGRVMSMIDGHETGGGVTIVSDP